MADNEKCIMVFVTPQKSCARLIEAGAIIAAKEDKKLNVISVIGNQHQNSIESLNYLYECVEKNNADMNIYFNNEPVITAAVAAKRFKASQLITGFPGDESMGFISMLHDLIPDIPITMIDKDNRHYRLAALSDDQVSLM